MPRKLLAALSLAALLLTGCSAADTLGETAPATEAPLVQSTAPTPNAGESPTPAPSAVASATAPPSTVEVSRAAVEGDAVRPGPLLAGPPASTVLESLPVKGKAPGTGYDRNEMFGNGWKDFDKNKCDERQDALSRDMSRLTYKDHQRCTVATGTLDDAYTGTRISWKVNSGSVDIDHVVALKNAWVSGAQQLSQAQRQALANDPLNLIATQARANRQKGDKNAAEWLPGNKAFRCQYVATQVSVKKKYALSVTPAEKQAMSRVLDGCANQPAAKVQGITPAGKSPAPASAAPATADAKAGKEPATVQRTVHPGSFCKAADAGLNGTSKTGKSYTCKSSTSDDRLRWRQ